MENNVTANKGLYIFILMGLILGIIIDCLIRQLSTHPFYYTFSILFFLFYALTYNEQHILRLLGTSALIAFILSLPFLGIDLEHPTFKSEQHFVTFCIAFPFCAYIAHCFHYGFHRDNTWKMDYSTLFEAVWTTIPLLITASIFGSLVNGLLFLAAAIFKTVGFEYLWDLYFNSRDFHIISSILFFFVGLGVVQQNTQLIYNLRFLLLKMMFYLFPILALLSVLYVLLYGLNYLTGGNSTVEPLIILIPLVALGIIFFNAFFQDGKEQSTYNNHSLHRFLRLYRLFLFILALIMAYKIVQATAIEINPLVALISVLLLTFIYAFTAFLSKDKETLWIYRGNIGTALFFLITLIALNLPYIAVGKNISFF